jgi:NAD(P)-dependent dehydrogenase (short-subunit alcohol dehydrogenase family)
VSSLIDLTGKVALVTGAGANGGIGHATALLLAQHGADVLISDLDEAGARTTAAEVEALGRRAVAVRCDNGEPDQIRATFAELDRAFGQIDLLVNNVGAGFRSRPEDLPLEQWQRVERVNLDGMFLCSQEAGRRMIARGQGGSIVNISSIAGSSALGRGNFVYSVTKGGVLQFTRELAVEWSIHGIRVNSIQPAQVMTPAMKPMFEDPRLDPETLRTRLLRGIPLGRLGEPEDIAKGVLFLASDLASWVTGISLPIDGGNLALNGGGDRVWPADL